ncbi:hypothetical protein EB796_015012 [Bugula neritina]|uniref:Uncharacterized protein n=1 Tax=Bugula neritina TaxID=10212 RepID=A0A7J7JKS2_BUGNE|nr:hypothetical protein EB796_015012 [Bugula neritina]
MGNCFGPLDSSHSANNYRFTGQPSGYGRAVAPPAQNQYPSNDYELVIRISRKLEVLLKTRYGAEGEGLGQLRRSVQDQLPGNVNGMIKDIVRIRNCLCHEENVEALTPQDRNKIKQLSNNILQLLNNS